MGATLLAALGSPAATGIAHAKPEPSVKELQAQAEKLGDQLERLTEQYNGLKVRLDQARKAARAATDNARRQEKSLSAVQQDVRRLAAAGYMNSGADPTASLFASQDPQILLDQASTLRYFANQNGTRAQLLLQTMQSAQRARKTAEARATQVRTLRTELDGKRKSVGKLYDKARGKLAKAAPEKSAELPPVAGSGKGAEALRYALKQLGVPYSWGGGSRSGPSFGIAQGANIKGFDCSGLTMYAYAQVGINLPHYTGSQWNAGVHVSRDQLQPGDLVFFHSDLHHMGMYVGGGKMVHAPQTGDVVKISPIAGRPWAGAVRVA
ncbi:NlpC/P60 family protein [Spirillospora sp. CA-294931]|uniref:C40 family peptidase n=1 Tax=Spirillospora sp. CA-294931 TaxID=3240042 RepID=UPI003D92D897